MLAEGWKPDDFLKAVALGGAAMAFGIGLWQYRRAQQWKRAEWIAQEMKQLLEDPIVQAVFLMIDWGSRRVPLYPTRANETERNVFLRDADVARALMLHDDRPDGFSELETDIRFAFDRLLDGLERFDSYVATGLVTDSDLAAHLGYWAREICSASNTQTEERLVRLRQYMESYGFAGALGLLRRIAAV